MATDDPETLYQISQLAGEFATTPPVCSRQLPTNTPTTQAGSIASRMPRPRMNKRRSIQHRGPEAMEV